MRTIFLGFYVICLVDGIFPRGALYSDNWREFIAGPFAEAHDAHTIWKYLSELWNHRKTDHSPAVVPIVYRWEMMEYPDGRKQSLVARWDPKEDPFCPWNVFDMEGKMVH